MGVLDPRKEGPRVQEFWVWERRELGGRTPRSERKGLGESELLGPRVCHSHTPFVLSRWKFGVSRRPSSPCPAASVRAPAPGVLPPKISSSCQFPLLGVLPQR